LSVPCHSEVIDRPACNARTRGRLWPELANSDPAVARQAARCGELRICALGKWKYTWQPLTVHIKQLGKQGANQASGCTAATAQNAKVD